MQGVIKKILKLTLMVMSALVAYVGGKTLIDQCLINPLTSALPYIIGTMLECYALFVAALLLVKASGGIYKIPSQFKKMLNKVAQIRSNYDRCKLCFLMAFIIASPLVSHVLWTSL